MKARTSKSTFCTIPGCDAPRYGKGYCWRHYLRWRRNGDPLAGRVDNGEPQNFLMGAICYQGDDCLIWPHARMQNGYAVMSVNQETQLVHRIVCTAVHGEGYDLYALHNCGNGHLGCVNPKHLRWGTQKDNVADAIAAGTFKFNYAGNPR